jgi:hypothetical protein
VTYRDDLEGALHRAGALERELAERRAEGATDKARIQHLEGELIAARQAIAGLRRGGPQVVAVPAYQPSSASTVLVLGILSVVVCSLLGPIAWSYGNRELERISAGVADPSGHGAVAAGRVLGIIASVMLVLAVVFFGVFLVLGASSR